MTVEPGGQIEADGASHDRELGIDACAMALALDRVPDRLLASLGRACRKPDPEVSRMGRALAVEEYGRVNDDKFPGRSLA